MSCSIRCSPRQLRVLAPHIYTSGQLAHIHIVLGALVLRSFSFLPARMHMLQRPSIARFFPALSPLCMMVVPIRISLHGCCGSGGGGGALEEEETEDAPAVEALEHPDPGVCTVRSMMGTGGSIWATNLVTKVSMLPSVSSRPQSGSRAVHIKNASTTVIEINTLCSMRVCHFCVAHRFSRPSRHWRCRLCWSILPQPA